MGKVIKHKIQGMSWLSKTSLVLLLTLNSMVFMYEGWYKPRISQGANITYYVIANNGTTISSNEGATNAATSGTSVAGSTTLAAWRTLFNTTNNAVNFNLRVTGATTGTWYKLIRSYISANYATNTQISGTPTYSVGLRSDELTDQYQLFLIDFDPAGAAGNGTVITSTAAINSPNTGTYTAVTGSFTALATPYTIVAGHRLVLEVRYKPATAGNEGRFSFNNSATAAYNTNIVVNETAITGGNLNIGDNAVSSANAAQSSTNNVLDGFTMFMSAGSGSVNTITVTGNANFNATNIPTNGVRIYRDAGTIGVLDGSDTLISTSSTAISGNASTVTLTSAEPVTTATGNYLAVVNLNPGAVVGNTITGTVSNATGTTLGTLVDNDTASATLTVTAGAGFNVTNGTNPANANASRGSLTNALDGFTLQMTTGTGSITNFTVTGSANFTATNIPTNGVKIYRDAGTVGVLDGADTLISSGSTAIATNATTVTLSSAETVTTTAANYLVVVDINAGATLAQTFTGTVTAATGSGYVSSSFTDSASATLTITAAQTLTVGNGTNPASANISTGGTAALDAFTLAVNTGSATVNGLTLTGSANFTAANIANVAVYADNGTIGTYQAGTDTPVATTYSHVGSTATITITTPEAVTTTAKNYLVMVTTTPGATVSQTFTGTITAATGTGIGTPSYSDASSATLTIIAGPIATIGNCNGCHGYTTTFNDGTARNTPAGQFPGSHNQHVITSATACSVCHVAPATTTSADFDHANGTINMASPLSGGSYVKGTSIAVSNTPTAATACNNTACHGTSSPTWGTSTTQATCTKCHGVSGTTPAQYTADNKTAAPGYNGGRDTGGATAATDAEVGAHAGHLAGSSNYSNPIACTECHANVNPASTAFTGHMNGAGNVNYGVLATANTATPGYTSPNCTNTYCHFGKSLGGYAPATVNASVAWTATTYLTGTPSLAGDCGKCHASPPSTTGEHSGVTNINQCSGCHDHVTATGSFSDKSKHINGVVDASSCSTCHGWPPTTGAHTVHINEIIVTSGLGSLPGGFVNNQVCGTCHNVSSLTKHAGTVGNDGTSRNIYLPTPSTLQASYQFGVNPVSYDKGGTTICSNISCHFGSSTAWGTPPTTSCQSCHGYPPVTTVADVDNKHVAGATPVNHIGTLAAADTKAEFVSVHGGCQICHGTQDSGTGTHEPHANYNVATQHFTGNINMNGPVGTGTGYDATIRGCTAACHASTAPYRMTASNKTLTFGNYGQGGDCLSCHLTTQPSPIAAGLNAAVTSRVAVTPSFSLASRHIRSRGTSVTNNDCCVCHMEGDTATGSPNGTYHKNGYIELRDPDTGATIKGVTHSGSTSAAGAYTSTGTDARPVRFSRNLNTATIEADTAAIMVNQCLKCHDADGALSALAVVPGGTAGKPFAGTIAANPSGNVLNVAGQFASTNKSFHPVLVRQNSGYTNTAGTRMVAPWNAVTKSASTTVYGPLITCWDCHAPPGTVTATTLTTSGIHGGAVSGSVVPLRGSVYVNGTTAATNLCLYCHVVSGGTTNHGTGSAITSGTDGSMTYFQNRCYFCHAANVTRTRPNGAGDSHGYNTRANGTAFPAVNNGYAFIRNEGWYGNSTVQSIRSIGASTYTPTCGGVSNTTGGGCSRSSMGGYTPGGVY